MQANKQIYVNWLISALNDGGERKDIWGKFKKKWGLCENTFDKYWKIAKEQAIKRNEALKKELEANDLENQINSVKKDILTRNERLEFLTKVIKGMAQKVEGKTIIASFDNRLKAIEIMNKMIGDDAPIKTETEIRQKNVIEMFGKRFEY